MDVIAFNDIETVSVTYALNIVYKQINIWMHPLKY